MIGHGLRHGEELFHIKIEEIIEGPKTDGRSNNSCI